MTAYTKWLLRSRIVLFIGGAMFFFPTLEGFDFYSDNAFKLAIHLIGLLIFIVGFLDCLGLVNRRTVKSAIREENERMRSGKGKK